MEESTTQFSEDSGFNSASFSAIYESTPKQPSEEQTRKRKFDESFGKYGESSLNLTPKIQDDLKKLKSELENCHIARNCLETTSSEELKHYTPVKLQEFHHHLHHSTFTEHSSKSPCKKEFNELLYRGIRSNLSRKFPLFKSSPVKKCLFDSSEKARQSKLLSRIIEIPVIMSGVFKYLSSGDLYRLSLVCGTFRSSIMNCPDARTRYMDFMEIHRDNKENYRVTPPRSPEKELESPPGSPSRFNEYFKAAKRLTHNQSLTKCPSCGKPSVVENSLSQCQDTMRCGYICCLRCFSFSKDGPDFFFDKCQSSALSRPSGTRLLSDMSNRQNDTLYSIFHSPKKMLEDSSGFYSEAEMSPKPQVKRNLNKSLRSIHSNPGKARVFQQFNEPVNVPDRKKQAMNKSIVPVIPLRNISATTTTSSLMVPESPPRVRTTPVCSRQSKRNLKRLTR